MIKIIRENEILIITEEEIKNDSLNKYSNIDILTMKINKESITRINEIIKEKYNYIVFMNKCKLNNELLNYLPIFFINNCNTAIFINELLINPILLECSNVAIDSIGTIEIGILLKHILRNNIKKSNFHFYNEIRKIKKIHNCDNYDIYCLQKNIYHAIEENYCQNSNIRKIQFRLNRSNIIKKTLYKILDDVIYKLKNTNELVFKELISIII